MEIMQRKQWRRVFRVVGLLSLLGGIVATPLALAEGPEGSQASAEELRTSTEGAQSPNAASEDDAKSTPPDFQPFFYEDSVTITAASRRPERLAEVPAAVSILLEQEIQRESAHGQLPKLLAFTAGVEATQSGLYDFNFNARGLNSSLNRRVLVLIDGRNPSMPFLGSQEWSTISLPLDSFESLEMIRGPSSALYGGNAVNGVLSVVTKQPSGHLGGRFSLLGGELKTQRLEAMHAGTLGQRSFFRLHGGYQQSDDFSRSRNRVVEYPGLAFEAVALPLSEVDVGFAGLRLDRTVELFSQEALLSVEGGYGASRGPLFVTGLGRAQTTDSRRPWGRIGLDAAQWSLRGSHTLRDTAGIVVLSTGQQPRLNTYRTQAEAQTHRDILGGKGRWVGGFSFSRLVVDSEGDDGMQTVLFERNEESRWGAFGQYSHDIGPRLSLTLAARWDEGDLYASQFSPKAAIVLGLSAKHTLRATYGEAFQAPSTSELLFRGAAGLPNDLSDLERQLSPLLDGVPLNFTDIPVLAVGNHSLEVETNKTFELGYHGILNQKLVLNAALYRSEASNFVSTLLPQAGTSLGRLNPSFGPYVPPAALSDDTAAAVLSALQERLAPGLFELLSNTSDGAPAFIAFSFTNVGRVATQGLEVSMVYSISPSLRAELSYSYLDFDAREEAVESPIAPNAPRHKGSLSLTYTGQRFDMSVKARHSDRFDWRGGLLSGPVPAYDVVDLSANLPLGSWSLGINVSNLLDERHYQIFGGDILRRRALIRFSYSW